MIVHGVKYLQDDTFGSSKSGPYRCLFDFISRFIFEIILNIVFKDYIDNIYNAD